jgi:hypothetical protein
MAQKVIEVVSVAKQGIDTAKVKADSTLSMRMKIFADGVDISKAEPLINIEKSATIKGQVEGKTEETLTADKVEEIKKEFQAEIDRYIAENRILGYINTKAVSDSLDVSKMSIEAVKIDG